MSEGVVFKEYHVPVWSSNALVNLDLSFRSIEMCCSRYVERCFSNVLFLVRGV